jgi:parallel beta-helix repeat protein
VTLTLTIVLMLSLFVIIPVKAETAGVIYIRADGSVDPVGALIQRDGTVYTFISSISGSIVVERDNIVVDGAGYALQGTGAYKSRGIDLLNRSNVTVSNLQMKYFEEGIRLGGFSNKIIDNHVTNNSNGVCLEDSSKNNIISGNNITNNGWGIRSRGSNNTIHANNITSNKNYGVYFDYSSDNSVVGNSIENNTSGLYFLLSSNNTVSHNIFFNNQKHVKDAYSDAPWLLDPSVNIWDDGVKGNSWSDYEERYPNATELGGSGVWDTPYVIYENNQDNHPLVDLRVIPEFPDEDEPTTPTAEPFPVVPVAVASVVMFVVAAGLLVYFTKFKKMTVEVENTTEEGET